MNCDCASLCRPIMDDAEIQDIAKLLWEAPFGVLSLDLEEDPETPKYVVTLTAELAFFKFHHCSSRLIVCMSAVSWGAFTPWPLPLALP